MRLSTTAFVRQSVFLLFLACITALGQSVGDFQLSAGASYDQQARTAAVSSYSDAAPTDFNVWVREWLDLDVSSSTFKWKKKNGDTQKTGAGDTSFTGIAVLYQGSGTDLLRPTVIMIYTAKVPTSDSSVSASRELDHVIRLSLSKPGLSHIPRLSIKLQPGIGIFGRNSGGNDARAILALQNKIVLDRNSNVTSLDPLAPKPVWFLQNDVTCYSKATKTPADCSDSIRLSHKFLSAGLELQGGAKIGLTAPSARFGLFTSLIYSGSFKSMFGGTE
jgi:hypothetical protein